MIFVTKRKTTSPNEIEPFTEWFRCLKDRMTNLWENMQQATYLRVIIFRVRLMLKTTDEGGRDKPSPEPRSAMGGTAPLLQPQWSSLIKVIMRGWYGRFCLRQHSHWARNNFLIGTANIACRTTKQRYIYQISTWMRKNDTERSGRRPQMTRKVKVESISNAANGTSTFDKYKKGKTFTREGLPDAEGRLKVEKHLSFSRRLQFRNLNHLVLYLHESAWCQRDYESG